MDIIRSNEFQQECQLYKNTKKNIKKRVDTIKETIEHHTKKEKADLEQAVDAFNSKVKRVMESSAIKKQTTMLEKEEKQMFYSINKVMDIFSQARDIIMKDDSIDDKTRQKYLISLEEKMLEKLYDKEEREHFKRMVSNMIIMIPGGGGGSIFGGPGGFNDMSDNRMLTNHSDGFR